MFSLNFRMFLKMSVLLLIANSTVSRAQEPLAQVKGVEQIAKLKERYAFPHDAAVTGVVVGKEFVATGDRAGALCMWDPDTGQLLETIFEGRSDKDSNSQIDLLQLNNEETKLFLVSNEGHNICQCDVASQGRNSPGGGRSGMKAFGVTPNGKMWAVVQGGRSDISFLENEFDENVVPSSAMFSISADKEVKQLTFAPDSKHVCTISTDGKIHLGDLELRRFTWSIPSKDIDPEYLAFCPNGSMVAVAGKKGAIRLLDSANGKAIGIFAAHDTPITAIAWFSDNSKLVTASTDGSVRVWDASQGKRLAEARVNAMAVRCLAVSSDDTFIVSGGDDNTVHVWELDK